MPRQGHGLYWCSLSVLDDARQHSLPVLDPDTEVGIERYVLSLDIFIGSIYGVFSIYKQSNHKMHHWPRQRCWG